MREGFSQPVEEGGSPNAAVRRAGRPGRRGISRIGLATVFAVVMVAGMLVPGSNASATRSDSGAAGTQEAQLLINGCRKITNFRVNVYNASSGGAVIAEWPVDMVFGHFGQASSGRWQSWMPRGVPADHPSAYAVWVQNGGHHNVTCPW